ncbi:MAG TPA: hypothetical protein DEP51_06720 [Clostridiales bacterium]|nr:hypothetical protein [Clostridiales bacterium]
MSELLKWWKRIKWIRRIIAIASIVTTVVSVYLWFSDITVYADVRKQEEVGITSELSDGSTAPSGSVQALLESCEKIAKYMHDHTYTYDSTASRTPDKYDGPGDGSCCAAYVCWCLHDANIIQGQEHYCNVHARHEDQNFTADHIPDDGVWKLLHEDPNWQKFVAKSVDELKPGDVQIYKTGTSHTNIYAGDGLYWDAGDSRSQSGAFVGETRTSSYVIGGDNGYTCSYRHISMRKSIGENLMDNRKNKLKKVLLFLIFFFSIIIVVISCYLLMNKNDKTNPINTYNDNNLIDTDNKIEENNINTNNTKSSDNSSIIQKADPGDPDPWGESIPVTEENLKLKDSTDSYSYFLTKQCLTSFYSSKQNAYNVLPNELKQYDISSFYGRIEDASFCIDDIYCANASLSKDIFVVYYRLEIGNGNYSNLCSIVKIDKKNLSFAIYPFEYLKLKNISTLNENDMIPIDIINLDYIDKTEYNHYRIDDISTTEVACIREVFERCRFDYDFDKNHLYSCLNEDYKNQKFENFDSFINYLNTSNILKGSVEKFQVEKMNGYTQYVVFGSYDNCYIVNYFNIMSYDLLLDNYTIYAQNYLNEYYSNFPNVQAKYCIDRVRKAINDKNYKFVYEKLDLVYKNSNFIDYNSFESYIKQIFYEKNSFELLNFKKLSSNIFEYTVRITDETGKSLSYRQLNMTVTLKNDADFVISITQ